MEADIFTLNAQIYKFGIGEVGKSLKMKLGFEVADEEAAAVLGKQNLFWVQDYYSEQLSGEIDNILKPYFTSDKTIGEVIDDFQKSFGKITDKGVDYFEGLAEHTTNRVRELGKITGYEKGGIVKYEIRAVMDDRTSDVCQQMNGQIFEVASGAAFRDTILSLSNPADIKDVAPWRTGDEISGLSGADLPPGMELPPYHWRCRTVTVAYFE
jgi:SPP1 gp7 family putative phage head morphogenesis protein